MEDERDARLRRMKWRAGGLLVLAGAVYVGAESLRGRKAQVLVVTHSPQVAARAFEAEVRATQSRLYEEWLAKTASAEAGTSR